MADRNLTLSHGWIFRFSLLLSMLVILLVITFPVSASPENRNVPQENPVCVWGEVSYYAGQYFYNDAGQQFLCYPDGSIHFTGVTMVPATSYYYPYSTCTTSCSAYSCTITCTPSTMYPGYYPYPAYYPYGGYYAYYSPNVLTSYPYYYYYYPSPY